MSELKVGDKAPLFKCLTSSNKSISLNDLKDQNIVLYFYPKDMTPGCTIEARDFSKLIDQFKKLDTLVIGASKDDVQSHDKFITKECITFPLLADVDGKLCDDYGTFGEKMSFGKKSMGIKRTTFFIDKNHVIKKIWNNVKAEGHAQEVLEFVKNFMNS